MKIGNTEVTYEEYETFRKMASLMVSELVNRLEADIGKNIYERSTFYAGFSGGVLAWCDQESYDLFQAGINKIPLGGLKEKV